MKDTPKFIKSLVKSNGKSTGRKAWSIDLETVWLPFFTATNAMKDTTIPHEALGAPLRLAYNTDGSVKFSKAGKPVIRIAKDISEAVKLVRENFVAGLQDYTNSVFTENGEGYKEQVKLARQAGKPIQESDKSKLDEALAKLVQEALAHAESEAEAGQPEKTGENEPERELAGVNS
jgi:hypothetical protein